MITFRKVVSAAVLTLLVAVAAPAAHADGVMIPGGSIGTSLYKSGTGNIFAMFVGSQAWYSDDLYFYLTVGGSSTLLFNNHTAIEGQTIDIAASSTLATGAEAIFSICANLVTASTPCTSVGAQTPGNQYYSGPASRNPDGQFHAEVWTRAAWLAGCAAVPTSCTAAGVAAVAADPTFDYIMGFEDSYDHNIDSDFNDLIFAVRGTTTPEPMTMSLLATGLVAMGAAGRLRRRRSA